VIIRRGDIYRADLSGGRGREAKGRATPVLVISSDGINQHPLVLTVVVGTAARNRSRSYSTDVAVTAAETGLKCDTVFMAFQIRALVVNRLVPDPAGIPKRAGVMPRHKMAEVDKALRLVLDLE